MLLLWFIEWLFGGPFKRLFWSGNSSCSVLQRFCSQRFRSIWKVQLFLTLQQIWLYNLSLYLLCVSFSKVCSPLRLCPLICLPFFWNISCWNPPIQAMARFPFLSLSPFKSSYSVKANGKQHFRARSTFAILTACNGHTRKIAAVGDYLIYKMALLVNIVSQKLTIRESKLVLQGAFSISSSEIFCDLPCSPVMIQVICALRNRSGHTGVWVRSHRPAPREVSRGTLKTTTTFIYLWLRSLCMFF